MESASKSKREKRELWAIRLTASEKAEIRARAQADGVTMSRFVLGAVNAAISGAESAEPESADPHSASKHAGAESANPADHPRDDRELLARLAAIEEHLERIGRLVELGAFG